MIRRIVVCFFCFFLRRTNQNNKFCHWLVFCMWDKLRCSWVGACFCVSARVASKIITTLKTPLAWFYEAIIRLNRLHCSHCCDLSNSSRWNPSAFFNIFIMNVSHRNIGALMHMSSACPWDRTPGQPGEYVGEYKGMNWLLCPWAGENSRHCFESEGKGWGNSKFCKIHRRQPRRYLGDLPLSPTHKYW